MSFPTAMVGVPTACLPQCTGCMRHGTPMQSKPHKIPVPITCHDLRQYGKREHSYRWDWGVMRRVDPSLSPEFMLR